MRRPVRGSISSGKPQEGAVSTSNILLESQEITAGDPLMIRAMWNNAVLAESDKTVIVEGNHYFPPDSVRQEYLKPSSTHTACPWKGTASYYDIEVNGRVNKDAAWYYPSPLEAAKHIAMHIAFWKGVEVKAV